MNNKIKINYVGSNYYNGDYYTQLDKQLNEDEKYKHMICTFKMENIPLFIVDIINSDSLAGFLTVDEVSKNAYSLIDVALYDKWYKIIKDKFDRSNNKNEHEFKENISLLYAQTDIANIFYTTSLYNVNKLYNILDKYEEYNNSNKYNRKLLLVKNFKDELVNTGLINNNIIDYINKYEKDDYIYSKEKLTDNNDIEKIAIPSLIINDDILVNTWINDITEFNNIYLNAVNYDKEKLTNNKIKVKTLN